METNGFNERVRAQILVEKLLLKRSPLDYQNYIETFRESLIDANPHQIESIIFALEKLENGGCILADEVGLGKTIEAGLVIAQYLADRKFNVLIIVPTSLAGQWNNELRERFQIPSKIVTSKDKRGLSPEEVPQLFSDDGFPLEVTIEKRGAIPKIEPITGIRQYVWARREFEISDAGFPDFKEKLESVGQKEIRGLKIDGFLSPGN